MSLSSVSGGALWRPAHEPFRFLVKVGYAVKGCVYGVLGTLALRVGIGEEWRLPSEHEAMRDVSRQSYGDAALVVVAAGLFFYALWRLLEALLDPYRVGHSLRGLVSRTAALVSAIGNGAAVLTALQFALGASDVGRHPKLWAALALREDWGPALLVVIGACVAGVGAFHVYEAFTDKFCERLDLVGSSRAWRSYVTWSGRVGFFARGVIFGLIGVAAIRAGQTLDPQKAKGLKEALKSLVEQPFGSVLLVATAAGLVLYALHLVTTAPIRKLGD